jgi:GNAT superfamily N-acetyltransferase
MVSYSWKDKFSNDDLNALHAEAFLHPVLKDDWWAQVNRHSVGWVCAKDGGSLVGFVNVAWDGGVHAFIVDTMVASASRRQGIGAQMVLIAAREARKAGCEWLHVDFEEHLCHFYFDKCGFKPASAGLIRL